MTKLLRQFGAFVSCGGLVTLLHYVLLASLVESGLLVPLTATCLAYAICASLNFYLRYRIVFRSDVPMVDAAGRAVLVSAMGLVLNAMIFAAVEVAFGLHYLLAQVIATACVLVWNFTASRYWVFADRPDDSTTAYARFPGMTTR